MTTMWTSETRKAEYLTTLKAQLGSVLADLTRMSPVLLGSEWHADRCDEARWLSVEIERLSK